MRTERPEPVAIDKDPAGTALAGASRLLRDSGRDALMVGAILLMITVGVITRLAGGAELDLLRALLLAGTAVPAVVAAVLVVRSRQTLLRALGEVRVRLGAPIDPRAPWTPRDWEELPIPDEETVRRETRRVLGAAYRCYDLTWSALPWALAAVAAFLVWTLVTPAP